MGVMRRMGNESATRSGRPPFWRSRSTSLVALVLITLALAAVLAYEAHDAARSHQATAERALRDYAAFAAWEFLAGSSDQLQASIAGALSPVTGIKAISPYEALPAPAVLAASAGAALHCENPADDSARYYFRLDFRDGSLATSGALLSQPKRAWLIDTVAAHARAVYQPDWRFAALLANTRVGDPIVYGVKYAEHGAPIAAYGFSICPAALGESLFRSVMARHPLLPTSLTGGEANDSLVAVTVSDASRRALFRSPAQRPSAFTADARLPQLGDIAVHAALQPRAIELLALGAMPRVRLPLLLGLLALTAAMVVVALMQLRRENELARLRADFISSVSHELRTPLAQILLFAETLSLGRVRSERERHGAADVIVQEGRRLMHLVENILHYSRAERRMTRLHPEPTALGALVGEIVDSWRPLAAAADVSVRTVLDDGALGLADRSALRQMLLNLLDNAVKYGPAGQTVTVTLIADRRHARILVDDQGPGIPPAEQTRIWDAFCRLERDANSAVAGSGIGLYVVRELAALQGGRTWVDTAPDGGARFIVELPGVDAPLDDERAERSPAGAGPSRAQTALQTPLVRGGRE